MFLRLLLSLFLATIVFRQWSMFCRINNAANYFEQEQLLTINLSGVSVSVCRWSNSKQIIWSYAKNVIFNLFRLFLDLREIVPLFFFVVSSPVGFFFSFSFFSLFVRSFSETSGSCAWLCAHYQFEIQNQLIKSQLLTYYFYLYDYAPWTHLSWQSIEAANLRGFTTNVNKRFFFLFVTTPR